MKHFEILANDHTPTEELVGLLPYWVNEYADLSNHPRTFIKGVLDSYGFPSPPMTGGEVDAETGTFSYPGDPDMSPIAVSRLEGMTVYYYHYAMISFVTKNFTEMYRLD